MKCYNVTKVNSETGEETNYGSNCEEDVRLITRGYKQDKILHDLYNRKGSKFFFIVTEITVDELIAAGIA